VFKDIDYHVEFRLAKPTDVNDLVKLDRLLSDWNDTATAWASSIKFRRIIVAVDTWGRVRGYIWFGVRAKDCLLIRRMGVHPNFRRNRVGVRLMMMALAQRPVARGIIIVPEDVTYSGMGQFLVKIGFRAKSPLLNDYFEGETGVQFILDKVRRPGKGEKYQRRARRRRV
jgi:GNAT superfamily N-acetyltransferase